MSRPRGARAAVVSALATLAVGASLLAAPTSAGSTSARQPDFRPQLVEVSTPQRSDKEALQQLGLDLTEHAGHDYIEVVLHTPEDLAALTDAGFAFDVQIPDLVARGVQIAEADAAYAARVSRSRLPSGRTSYRTLEDYNADMTRLARHHKSLVRKFRLERPSLDGRPIHGIEIGRNVRSRPDGRPTFLLMGLHHAREWPSGELAMEFAFDLVRNRDRSPRIRGLLDRARVLVVPVVNVDGFHLSRTHGEYVDLRELNENDPLDGSTSVLATPGQTYMRKNCRVVDGQDTPDGSCAATLASPGGFGLGVDLNRNYGGFWGGPGAAGTAPDPSGDRPAGLADPTYRGAAAFSEPETQNIQDLVSRRQVTMMISNHTYSNLVLRPNGVNPNTVGPDGKPVGNAPDEQGLKRLGARMAAQNGYDNIHGWQLYDTTGTTEDWSYNATGGFGYTFEIGAHEFHPPYAEVVDEYLGAGDHKGKGNREAYLIALEHAVDTRYSGVLTGKAPEGATIRLSKTFRTPTWEGSFEDRVDTVLEVGRERRFEWIVNPSTRPVVRPRSYEELRDTPYRKDVIEGTTPEPTGHQDHEYTLTQDADLWRTELSWPLPDDMDLEVYRKEGDELTKVGSSGAFVNEKEKVEIVDAPAGTYVIRVINFASASPTYTLTESHFDSVTRWTEGERESYRLTCEKRGRVLQAEQVFIGRGQERRIDLSQCRRRW